MSDSLHTYAKPLEACLGLINRHWFGEQGANAGTTKSSSETLFSSPEALRIYANAINLVLDFKHDALNTLKEDVFPCIIVLDDGRGLVATAKNANCLEIQTDQTCVYISTAELAKSASGTVISVSRARTNTAIQQHINALTEDDEKEFISKQNGKRSNGFRLLVKEMIGQHKGTISLILIATFLSNMAMIALPLFTMSVYDRVVPNGAMETLWALSIGVLLAIGLDLLLRYVRIKLIDAASIDTASALQTRLYKKLVHAKLQDSPRQASIWQNAFKDIENATALIPMLLSAVLVDLPFVFITLALIFSIAQYTIFAPIAGILILLCWTFFAKNMLVKSGRLEANIALEKSAMVYESASLLRTLKTTNAEPRMMARFEHVLDDTVLPTHQTRLVSGMQAQSMIIMVQSVIVVSIIIGVYLIVDGSMSVGALAATTLLTGRVLLPAGNIMFVGSKVGQLQGPINHVYDLLSLEQEQSLNTEEKRRVTQGNIVLTNTQFTFKDAPKPALQKISITLNPGEKVAVIGKSGSGKSTLLQIIARILEPSQGAYMLDGFNIGQFSHSEVRSHIAYMPQETELLDASILENVRVSYPQATPQEIDHALSIAGAEDFLKNSAEGIGFRVGLRGEYLSGGERQSIGLARTLLRPSKVVILDEPTSSMDNTSEARVMHKLKDALKDKTLILATHRANLLSLADRIIWMDNGQIIADDTRDNVLAKMRAA